MPHLARRVIVRTLGVLVVLCLLGLPARLIDWTMDDNEKYGNINVQTEPYTKGATTLEQSANIRLAPHVITDDRGNACAKLTSDLVVYPTRITSKADANGPWLAFPISQLPTEMQEACSVRKDNPQREVWVSTVNVRGT